MPPGCPSGGENLIGWSIDPKGETVSNAIGRIIAIRRSHRPNEGLQSVMTRRETQGNPVSIPAAWRANFRPPAAQRTIDPKFIMLIRGNPGISGNRVGNLHFQTVRHDLRRNARGGDPVERPGSPPKPGGSTAVGGKILGMVHEIPGEIHWAEDRRTGPRRLVGSS